MSRTVLAIAAVALLTAGCGPDVDRATDLSAEELKAAPVKASYALRATDARDASPAWKSSFVITDTYDVYLAADVGAATGHLSATVFVKMPGGGDYQRFDLTYAAGVKAAAGEQVAEKVSGGYRVWLNFPVAGTMIEQYGLSGAWSAEAYLNGASASSATATFTLE